MPLHVGLDIGGTKLLVAAANEHSEIKRRQEPTPQDLPTGLALLQAMIADVSGGKPLAGIGAAIGGPLDWKTGVVSPLHQPQWRNIPLKQIMQQRWNCTFHVDVDTNVAALGEYHFGGEQPPRLLYLTLSTGMGGGLLVNGRILRGASGAHPEAGHQAIPYRCAHPEKVACECGAPDCLEALVSGNAIRRVYGKRAEELSEPEWSEVSYNLGQGLRNLAVLYAPDLIVLAGGVALGRGERLLADAGQVMRERLKLVPVPRLRLSALGADAPLLGALAVARHGLGAAG